MTIKSRQPIFSRAARADLRSIYKYIATENPAAAAALILDINAKINSIARSGFPGVARDEFGQDLRACPFRDRCIYFRVEATYIYILRILHGRQDISPKDFPESET